MFWASYTARGAGSSALLHVLQTPTFFFAESIERCVVGVTFESGVLGLPDRSVGPHVCGVETLADGCLRSDQRKDQGFEIIEDGVLALARTSEIYLSRRFIFLGGLSLRTSALKNICVIMRTPWRLGKFNAHYPISFERSVEGQKYPDLQVPRALPEVE